MHKNHLFHWVLAAVLIASMVLTACAPVTVTVPVEVTKEVQVQVTKQVQVEVTKEVQVVVTPTSAPTEAPTAAPTPKPVGTADNPIILALAPSATTQSLQTGGQAIADAISKATGYTVKISVPTSYAALIEAMGAGNAHVGFMPPLAYMLAKFKGYADVGLVVLRSGSDHYGFQYVVYAGRKNADGTPMFTSFYDAKTGKSTGDAKTALAQLAGKKPCWTDPLSASGYVLPYGLLASTGVKVKAGAWVQGHPTVINSVYLSPNGEICDFGATYIDARTAVVKAFPDVNDKVVVIYVSDPIIPNDNVAYASNVPADVRAKLTQAFLDLASNEAGLTLLKNGGYDIGGLKAVDDTFYDNFRVYLQAAGYDYTSFK